MLSVASYAELKLLISFGFATGLQTRSIFNRVQVRVRIHKKLQVRVRVRVRVRVHKKITSSSSSFVLINLINYFTRIRISSLVKHEVITIYNILGRTLINLFYTYQIFYPG